MQPLGVTPFGYISMVLLRLIVVLLLLMFLLHYSCWKCFWCSQPLVSLYGPPQCGQLRSLFQFAQGAEKKVEKVITALREWIQISYGLERQAKEFGKRPEEFMKLEPEPDVILAVINVPISASVGEQSDDPFLGETHDIWPIQDLLFDLKLKEECQGDMVCL